MPVLKDFRHTTKISIPSYPDSEIVIFNSLLASETDDVLELQGKPSVKKVMEILPKFIKEWNFTDESGKMLPVTSENLNFMAGEDIEHILQEIKNFNESLKKK